MSVEKNMFKKIQQDIKNSNPKIVNSNDDLSNIKKNFNPKYSEDLSDSDDDLSSYKLRHRDIVNKITTKADTKPDTKPSKSSKNKDEDIQVKPVKKNKNLTEEIEELANELDSSKNSSKKSAKKNKKKEESDDSDTSSGSDDESGEEEDVEYEYTEELADKVKLYVKNDDRIRELQTELRKLNQLKKAAELEILKHLERLGETNINITGGKLRINQYESKDSLKEDLVKEALEEKLKDPSAVEKIFEKINEKREAGRKIQISLKRTFERGGGKKK